MKKERNLLKLISDDDCLNASEMSFANAEIHKQTACEIAKKKYYGVAISHLILSTEELIKGGLLLLQYMGFDVRNTRSVHLFFTDHVIRHKLAARISLMYPMLEVVLGIANKLKEKVHNPGISIEYTETEKMILDENIEGAKKMFKDLPEMMDWWEDANMKKNKGTYVDYSNGIETPMDISKFEYDQSSKIVDTFYNQVLKIVSHSKKATNKDRKAIANSVHRKNINKILEPIIEERRLEMRSKVKKSS